MNEEVYIVGGGRSLKGFNFQDLTDLTTIAVNEAALDVPNPNYCVTADSSTFRKLNKGYFKEVINTTWVLVSNPDHCTMKMQNGQFKNIKTGYVYNLFAANMIIKNAGCDGIGFSFKDFRTGYNSGFCAFQLAVLLGYTKIHLLGFDFVKGGISHYHGRYSDKTIQNSTLDQFYDNFVLAFNILKEKRPDIKIISHSSISRLNGLVKYKPFKLPANSLNKPPEIPPNALNLKSGVISLKTAITPQDAAGDVTQPTFSILICSLENRKDSLFCLLNILKLQDCDRLEILIMIDDGELSIGTKRNRLLEKAKGDYIAFVDDDDRVVNDYVSKILKALESEPDCCSLEGIITNNKKGWSRTFIHSLKYDKWFIKDNVYYRNPNHLSPVRRELALRIRFPDINSGEDKDYSTRLLPLLKIEEKIEGVLYYYDTGF